MLFFWITPIGRENDFVLHYTSPAAYVLQAINLISLMWILGFCIYLLRRKLIRSQCKLNLAVICLLLVFFGTSTSNSSLLSSTVTLNFDRHRCGNAGDIYDRSYGPFGSLCSLVPYFQQIFILPLLCTSHISLNLYWIYFSDFHQYLLLVLFTFSPPFLTITVSSAQGTSCFVLISFWSSQMARRGIQKKSKLIRRATVVYLLYQISLLLLAWESESTFFCLFVGLVCCSTLYNLLDRLFLYLAVPSEAHAPLGGWCHPVFSHHHTLHYPDRLPK